jgi:hypothetical protein
MSKLNGVSGISDHYKPSGGLTYLFPAVRAMVSGKCAGWTVTMLNPRDQGEHVIFEGLENY